MKHGGAKASDLITPQLLMTPERGFEVVGGNRHIDSINYIYFPFMNLGARGGGKPPRFSKIPYGGKLYNVHII